MDSASAETDGSPLLTPRHHVKGQVFRVSAAMPRAEEVAFFAPLTRNPIAVSQK